MRKLNLFLRECQDYLEYFVIPALSVIMPWWLAIRFFHWIAYIPFLYCDSAQTKLLGARQLGLLNLEEKVWVRCAKVALMVDLADMFWVLLRGDSYVRKYIDNQFSCCLTEQQIIFTPHYGAGAWVYRILQQQHIPIAMLINHPTGKYRARDLCARFRLWALRRIGVLVFDADDIMSVRQALREKRSLLIMPDMPLIEGVGSYQITTELGELNVTSGFFKMAEARKIPVIQAIFDFNIETGKRQFNAQIQRNLFAKNYAQNFAQMLVSVVQKSPYLWHMLVVAPQVMLPSETTQ